MESIVICQEECVKVQHTVLLTNTLTLLATQGWNKPDYAAFGDVALNSISTQPFVPLEPAGVNVALFKAEWEDMIEYARRYLNLVQEDHQTI